MRVVRESDWYSGAGFYLAEWAPVKGDDAAMHVSRLVGTWMEAGHGQNVTVVASRTQTKFVLNHNRHERGSTAVVVRVPVTDANRCQFTWGPFGDEYAFPALQCGQVATGWVDTWSSGYGPDEFRACRDHGRVLIRELNSDRYQMGGVWRWLYEQNKGEQNV